MNEGWRIKNLKFLSLHYSTLQHTTTTFVALIQCSKTMMDIKIRIQTLLKSLTEGLYERNEAMQLALLSVVAGESIFLLGPPGVGKSLIARRLKYAFKDGVSFEYLMSKFSTPDEIFGPISIKKLKEEDKYERLTDRYLPGANIVFLDEIWKAGPAIQNALLTILNEKIYRNGEQDIPIAVRGIITASNEIPPPRDNLAPIWDRFLIRLQMDNIKQFKHFLDMITDTKDVYHDHIPQDHKLSNEELDQWSDQIDAVAIPAEVLNTIQLVKVNIDQYDQKPNSIDFPLAIFDRRWKKIVRLMRTSAFLNGRSTVNLMDCFLMVHCLWSRPDQKSMVEEIINDAIRKHGYAMAVNLQMIRKEVNQFEEEVQQEIRVPYIETKALLLPINEDYYGLKKLDADFEGAYLTIKQFAALRTDQEMATNVYNEDFELVNRLKARKSKQENAVDIFYNASWITYPLRTKEEETTQWIDKKPHPLVEQFWEERYRQLQAYIKQKQEALTAHRPKELDQIEKHLFVPANRSEIVLANINEVAQALQQLNLQLEKIQYAYTSLDAS